MRLVALRVSAGILTLAFSLSSRSGLQTEIVMLYVLEFIASYTSEAAPQTAGERSKEK